MKIISLLYYRVILIIRVVTAWTALLLLLSPLYAAEPLDTWTDLNSSGGSPILGFTYGNGIYLAITSSGLLMTSSDAQHWQSIGYQVVANTVTFGHGQFVATTRNNGSFLNGFMTSIDGVTWTTQEQEFPETITGLAFGNNRFVAVANGGVSLVSTNGRQWTRYVGNQPYSFNSLTFNNGRFVSNGGTMQYSEDGILWLTANYASTFGSSFVGAAGDRFISLGWNGGISQSGDGVSWTNSYTGFSTTLYSATYGNGMYVAVGDFGTVLTSTNGYQWTRQSLPMQTTLQTVFFAAGWFLTGSRDGFMAVSTNGVQWTPVSANMSSIYNVVFAGGKYVGVGVGMGISDDGLFWRKPNVGANASLYGAAYGLDQYVVVGDRGNIRTSVDGLSWTSRASGVSQRLSSVVFGNNRFVTVSSDSSNIILVSTNGTHWTPSQLPTSSRISSISFGNGLFVLVAYGTIYTSTNGFQWTSTISDSMNISALAYGNNGFVGFDYYSTKAYRSSPDGITWTNTSSPSFYGITSVTYGGGYYVAVGQNGVILSSTNGLDWNLRTSPTEDYLTGIAFGNNAFIAVGNQGTILKCSLDSSPMFTAIAPQLLAGAFQFTVNGKTGMTCLIEYSTDMRSWNPLTNGILAADKLLIQDFGTAKDTCRFYRIKANQ